MTPDIARARDAADLLLAMLRRGVLGSDPETILAVIDLCQFVEDRSRDSDRSDLPPGDEPTPAPGRAARGDSGPFEARVISVWYSPLEGWRVQFGYAAYPLDRVVAVMLPPGNAHG